MKPSFLAVTLASLLTSSYSTLVLAQHDSSSQESSPETIVVTANRFEQIQADNLSPTVVLTKADLEQMQAKSLIDVFRTLPSVELAQNGGRGQLTSVYVRGGSTAQVLILVDGVRMARSMMGEADIAQVPIASIERIEYIRGARASIYGSEAISGVINIITRAGSGQNYTQVHLGMGSKQRQLAELSTKQNISDQGQLQASLGYEKTQGYNVHPVAGLNEGDKHGFKSFNAQLGYQHQWSDAVQTYVSASAYNNELDYDNSSYGNPSWGTVDVHQKKTTEIEARALNAQWRLKEAQFSSELSAAWSRQDNYDFNSGENKHSGGHIGVEQTNAAWLNSYQFTSAFSLGAGVDFRRERLKDGNTGYGFYSADYDQRDNLGLLSLAQYHQDQWTWEASVRSDDNEQYGRFNTWQIGLGWQLTEQYKLTASTGTAFRAPSFVDLYYPGSEAPNLRPEEAKNSEVSLTAQQEWFDWGITLYRNKIDNMLLWDDTAGISGWGAMQNIGQAEIKGIELALGLASGAVHHQFYLDYKDPVDKSGAKDEQLANRSKRSAKWNASVEVQEWTLGTYYQYQGKRVSGYERVQLGGYSLWALTAEYAVSSQLRLQARIDNLFDKEYETNLGYPAAGREYALDLRYQF